MAQWPQRFAARLLLDGLAPRIDQRISASKMPFSAPGILRPEVNSRRWASTHYGVFVPELPAPHRYLNTMTLIGATGSICFDNDYLSSSDARRTATVLSSTAAPGHRHYRAYDTHADCAFDEDGSALTWGDDLTLTANFPSFTVDAQYPQFAATLTITATHAASWFVRSMVCDHLSLLATCTGVIEDATGTTDIAGLCTVEYARYMSPQALTSRPLPGALKLPLDFFTYQIVNLDETTQLLLTDVRAAGVTACRLAHIRSLDGANTVYEDVTMSVTRYRGAPAIDELGRPMRVPQQIHWIVRENGRAVVEFTADVDSELRYGHGRGYAGAYSYTGAWLNRPIAGSGYLEWIDCES